MVDYIAKKVYANQQSLASLDAKVSAIQVELQKFKESQKDIKDLVKEEGSKRFEIKKSEYEVSITMHCYSSP